MEELKICAEQTTQSDGLVPPLKIYKKMLDIAAKIGVIPKEGVNAFHKYSYVTEATVKEKVLPFLVKEGILFQPTKSEIISVQERENTAKGVLEYITRLGVTYRFVDTLTGEFIEGSFESTGHDPLDKGVFKAYTGAIKYILTSHFLIATGDDPEKDEARPQFISPGTAPNKFPYPYKGVATNEPTPIAAPCDQCGSEMKQRKGSSGPFWGCSSYPDCRYTRPYAPSTMERIASKRPVPKSPRKVESMSTAELTSMFNDDVPLPEPPPFLNDDVI